MNDLTQQLLLTGIGGFLIGTGFTWLLTRGKKQDKTELDAARQELQTYRQEVERHFIDTADAVDELTRSYQKVFTHLSRGAETLMSQESYRSQLEKRSGQAVTLAYLSQQTTDTAAEQANPDTTTPADPLPADVPELPQNRLDDINAASNAAPVFDTRPAEAHDIPPNSLDGINAASNAAPVFDVPPAQAETAADSKKV
ncbi:YhcB family protein [Neisseria shayeganii]|uniref:Z-ring associated protein G n=1 Tax=Neisseria shayeganii 871 TaxID=1032488 RepID=G4CFK1_9NEIS|nr:DUF1043 family protein [Neisseria shayeganii]EGY53377.1 hypothetical protein HMPREF9371_0390 [Neisseria shayeganii 871]